MPQFVTILASISGTILPFCHYYWHDPIAPIWPDRSGPSTRSRRRTGRFLWEASHRQVLGRETGLLPIAINRPKCSGHAGRIIGKRWPTRQDLTGGIRLGSTYGGKGRRAVTNR